MGRTVHYSILDTEKVPVTSYERSIIQKLEKKYNTSYDWTCESIDILDWGFTKVSDNELNANLVVKYVLELSTLLPDRTIKAYDEGDCLYCPLFIKNGKAKPNTTKMKEQLAYWRDKDYLHNGGLWDVTSQEAYYNSLLKKTHTWDDIVQYVRPLKPESLLTVQRTEFLTTEFNHGMTPIGMSNIIGKFLENEQIESMKYYDDVKKYPEVS